MDGADAPESTVRAALAAYVSSGPTNEQDLRRIAGEVGVLPLLLDWSGFVGLRPSGDLLWVDYDPPYAVTPLEQVDSALPPEHVRHLAYVRGSRRYPSLTFLRRERDADAVPVRPVVVPGPSG